MEYLKPKAIEIDNLLKSNVMPVASINNSILLLNIKRTKNHKKNVKQLVTLDILFS